MSCSIERGSPVRLSFFGALDLNRIEDPEPATLVVCQLPPIDGSHQGQAVQIAPAPVTT
jgi:hypothetical protein